MLTRLLLYAIGANPKEMDKLDTFGDSYRKCGLLSGCTVITVAAIPGSAIPIGTPGDLTAVVDLQGVDPQVGVLAPRYLVSQSRQSAYQRLKLHRSTHACGVRLVVEPQGNAREHRSGRDCHPTDRVRFDA